MGLILFAAPSEEPLALAEVKTHLRIDFADAWQDGLLNGLIIAARIQAETITKRQLVTATWDHALDRFPCGEIVVPLATLQSVTSITYLDDQGASQTLASADYKVDSASEPARIRPAYGKTWPSTRAEMNAVTLRFVAGYGGASAVPAAIKQWMLLRIGALWMQREGLSEGGALESLPHAFADGLLDPYRVYV